MRMNVNDPSAIPSLIAALRDGACVADRVGPATVAVRLPWLVSLEDARQARVELAFFVRAWAAAHSGVTVELAF